MRRTHALHSELQVSRPLSVLTQLCAALAGRTGRGKAGWTAGKARAFGSLLVVLAALAACLAAEPAQAQTPVSEITDSDGNALVVVYDNGQLEVTGGVLLPDGTLIDDSSDLGGGFSLPFSSTTSASGPLLQLTQTGDGPAGQFVIDNPDGFTDALMGRSNGESGNAVKGIHEGSGRAGLFQILNDASSAEALAAKTNGTGRAGDFQITNVESGADVLFAETVGIGRAGLFRIANAASGAEAVRAETNGGGHAGVFKIDNTSNDSSAVQGITNGTGPAVEGFHKGAEGHAGDFEIINSENLEAAVFAQTHGTGPAVEAIQVGTASDSSAHAGFFEIANSSSDAEALLVETNGSGEAIEAIQSGTGSGATAGQFLITSSNNDEAAIRAGTFGSGFAAKLFGAKSATVRNNPAGNVVLMRNTSDRNDPDVLGLQAGPSDPGVGVNYVSFYDRSGSSVGAIEGNGSGGVEYKTSGADYAEALPVAEGAAKPEPTDVVGVRGGAVGLATDGADRLMVVTGQAAVLGNAPSSAGAEEARRVPVAFVGQVPVKVRGAAAPGDWIVASGRGDGTARAVALADYRPAQHGPIVGQAWSAKPGAGLGRVTVAVGLDHTAAVAERLQDQQNRIDALRVRVRRLEEVKAQQERMAEQVAALQAHQSGSFLPGWSSSALLAVLLGIGGFGAVFLWRRRV